MADQPPSRPTGPRRLLSRLAGDRDRLGWWTLPAFLVVGLAGAVLAGAFVVVWQTQKIQALEDSIDDALAELRSGVEAVQEAGDQALADIAAQVGDVEAVVNAGLPVEAATDVGVALLRVDVPGSSSSSRSRTLAPAQEPSDGPSDAATPQPAPQETVQPAPAPAPTARVGSAVAVAIDGATTFFATSYALVADPDRPGEVLSSLSLDVGRGRVRAVVHSWDETRDLALVRAEVGAVTLAKWRSDGDPVAAGERAFVIGLTTSFATVQQPGAVTFTDGTTLLSDHDVVGTLRGAAVIDREGRLLAIASSDYRPFVDDDRPANIPVRLLCERLLRSCDGFADDEPTDEATDPDA